MAAEEKTILDTLSRENGFDLFGVASASAPPSALANLSPWLSQGLHGGKDYLKRQEARRLDPNLVLPGVKSILCFGLLYNTDKPYSIECPNQPWISRYAWGEDYHEAVGARLKAMEQGIQEKFPGTSTLSFCDSGPVSEKPWAVAAGLGWQGKNTVLINPKLGSWLFLGVILSDLALEPDVPEPDHCGTCCLCLDACPTGALKQPYVLDVSKCVSSLNFSKGGLAPEQEKALSANLLGCDICQDVCPWNRSKKATAERAFQCRPENWHPDLDRLAKISDEDFKKDRGNSYAGKLRPSLLRRNAEIVKGNLHADSI